MLKRLALTLAVMVPVAGPCFAQAVTVDDVTIEFYGQVQLDAIYDFDRVDPDWIGAFRPSKIPTTDGAFGDNGEANFSVRQTTFGMKGTARSPTRRLRASSSSTSSDPAGTRAKPPSTCSAPRWSGAR
jgi:hypothetical protein